MPTRAVTGHNKPTTVALVRLNLILNPQDCAKGIPDNFIKCRGIVPVRKQAVIHVADDILRIRCKIRCRLVHDRFIIEKKAAPVEHHDNRVSGPACFGRVNIHGEIKALWRCPHYVPVNDVFIRIIVLLLLRTLRTAEQKQRT